jgi:hypothetical protein
MNEKKIKEDLVRELKHGLDLKKFEKFLKQYRQNLEKDVDIVRTLQYSDLTNRVIRLYIRSIEQSWTYHIDMDTPTKIELTKVELAKQ